MTDDRYYETLIELAELDAEQKQLERLTTAAVEDAVAMAAERWRYDLEYVRTVLAAKVDDALERLFPEEMAAYRREIAERRAKSRKPISGSLRTRVYERDAYRCVKCGSHEDLAVDHIHPVSKGGTNEFDNLQTLCRPCNSAKRDRIEEDDG